MHCYGFVAPGEQFIDGAELDSDLLVLASSQYDRCSERTGHVSRLTLRKPGKEISAKLSKARDLDGHLANEQLDIGEVAVGLKTGATQEHVARDDRRRAASGHACDRQAQVIASAVRRKLAVSKFPSSCRASGLQSSTQRTWASAARARPASSRRPRPRHPGQIITRSGPA
jgi:hypothetical protein